MIKPIYTSVTDANLVPCNRRKIPVRTDPIPLLRNNYLGEYRTSIEKAKVRKNLGIADDLSLEWGNIKGNIENQIDLSKYVNDILKYTTSVSSDITTIKEALDYAYKFIGEYKSNSEEVEEIRDSIKQINSWLSDVDDLKESVKTINDSITDLNNKIKNIDVDLNIATWVSVHLLESQTIELTETSLEVKISDNEQNAISLQQGLYVKDLSKDVLDLSNKLDENLKTYDTSLPDDTTSPSTVGGISSGTSVKDLKGKTITEILDTMLFPSYVRDLIYPTLTYSVSSLLIEVGSSNLNPECTFNLNDAGKELSRTESLTFNNIELSKISSYDSLGIYKYTTTVNYDEGTPLVNNKGEETNKKISAGSITSSINIETTYPWYSGNKSTLLKLQLVKFNTNSQIFTISLNGNSVIKLPGKNSLLLSFKVDGGLGYLDVDLDGWNTYTEELNGTTYSVWEKVDSYSSVLKHTIQFILKE